MPNRSPLRRVSFKVSRIFPIHTLAKLMQVNWLIHGSNSMFLLPVSSAIPYSGPIRRRIIASTLVAPWLLMRSGKNAPSAMAQGISNNDFPDHAEGLNARTPHVPLLEDAVSDWYILFPASQALHPFSIFVWPIPGCNPWRSLAGLFGQCHGSHPRNGTAVQFSSTQPGLGPAFVLSRKSWKLYVPGPLWRMSLAC